MLKKVFLFRRHRNILFEIYKCNFFTIIPVNDYLKNRSLLPKEILSNLLPEDRIRLESIKEEHITLLTNCDMAPMHLTDENFLNLLCMSKNERSRHYKYLYHHDINKNNKINIEHSGVDKFILPDELSYTSTSIYNRNFLSSKLLNNQKLIFDMSFENSMTIKAILTLSDQVYKTFLMNNSHLHPYRLIFTEVNKNGLFYSNMKNWFNQIYLKPNLMSMEFYEESYLDLFPNDRFAYLSPDSHNILKTGYDHNVTYILGGVVDTNMSRPFTLKKARRQGLDHWALHRTEYTVKKEFNLHWMFSMISKSQMNGGDWSRSVRETTKEYFDRNNTI